MHVKMLRTCNIFQFRLLCRTLLRRTNLQTTETLFSLKTLKSLRKLYKYHELFLNKHLKSLIQENYSCRLYQKLVEDNFLYQVSDPNPDQRFYFETIRQKRVRRNPEPEHRKQCFSLIGTKH